jgi:hypothetical protein
MIAYTLNKETFNKSYNLQTTHLYKKIWTDEYVQIMDLLIKQFNTEYKWDGMFTLDDVTKRIDSGEHLFILFVSDTPIGYIWFKELNITTCYLYNVYVSKVIKRPNFSVTWFINKVCFEMFKHYKKIETECEDWHITMQNTFTLNGFTEV